MIHEGNLLFLDYSLPWNGDSKRKSDIIALVTSYNGDKHYSLDYFDLINCF